jgi:hypothetical protein
VNNTAAPLTNEQVRDGIRKFGLPSEADKVASNLRVIRSTKFFEEGATLSSMRFFGSDTNVDGYWNNYKFPQQEVAVIVRGIAIDHSLHFAASPVDIYAKQQQVFEQSSYLRFRYRRRPDRLVLRAADLLPYQIVTIGNTAATVAKPGSVFQNGFYMLPEAGTVGLAAQIEMEWLLDIQSGFTLGAAVTTGATAQPVVTGGGLVGAGNYISLLLLIEELTEVG